jgi:hypothetical protein
MLSVYVRHRNTCKYKEDAVSKRCTCIKWLVGTLPGRKGRFRVSAKTTSWELAEGIARQYESAAAGGKDMEAAMSLPTVEDAVDAYLSDARAAASSKRPSTSSPPSLKGPARLLRARADSIPP